MAEAVWADGGGRGQAAEGAVGAASAIRLSPDCRPATAGRLGRREAAGTTVATERGAAGAAHAAQAGAARRLDWIADAGAAPGARVVVGLHRGFHRPRRGLEDPDDSGRVHAGMPRPACRSGLEVRSTSLRVAVGFTSISSSGEIRPGPYSSVLHPGRIGG